MTGYKQDLTILSYAPHMHVRGKAFSYEAIYPDGKREMLLDVPHYDFNWQTNYELAEAKTLPPGTRVHCVAHWDNSDNNLANPDPDATVNWGDQTWEEMMIGFFDVAIPWTKKSCWRPARFQNLSRPLRSRTAPRSSSASWILTAMASCVRTSSRSDSSRCSSCWMAIATAWSNVDEALKFVKASGGRGPGGFGGGGRRNRGDRQRGGRGRDRDAQQESAPAKEAAPE